MSLLKIPETRAFRLQPKQREFARSEADIVVYGGSAGGGKSFALLYDPIGRRLHRIPGFTGIIFRRDSKQITNAGALWDQASELYPAVRGRGYRSMLEYRFPAGSLIAFRHIEHEGDKERYQGTEICYLGFDELTHFTESQFWYLLSRNRSTCGVRPYVRCTCNPDPGWVKSFIAPWVDEGFAGSRALSGELRWFVRVQGEIKWVDQGFPKAKSLTFIRSSVYDNQILLDADPSYIATLEALPPIERARLLDGDWNVRREGLVYAGFESCLVESHSQGSILPSVGGMDFGIHNPFAAISGHLDGDDVLWITGVRYKSGVTLPVHSEAIPKGIEWFADPSGAEQIRQLREAGHSVRPCVHQPVRLASGEAKKPLMAGIDMVSERMRTGRLKIIRESCMPLVRELGLYHYDPEKQVEEPVKEDDHTCDALRYLVVGLDRGRMPRAYEEETQEQLDEKARVEEAAETKRKREEDLRRQGDAEDDIWWTR